MTPSVRKLLLTSAAPYSGALLSIDFVGSRSNGQPYYMLNGAVYPRVDMIPGWTYTGGTPAGTGSYAAKANGSLQFFPSYTNLLLQSQTFDSGAWGKSGTTVSADATPAPDGTTTADKIAEDTSTGVHNLGRSVTVASSTTYIYSVYLKAGERLYAALYDGASAKGKFFNLSTGAVLGNLASAPDNATITSVGDGWYRCAIIITTATTSFNPYVFLSTDGTTFNYAGSAGSGVYAWGAQLELGSTASTYIPTTSAAVTVAPPRITDLGYLAEEARTNSIRNSTATNGAAVGVIGSGGVLPTNWGHAGGSTAGLTTTVVATGTDEGLPYIDIRYSGTTSSTSLSLIFETTTAIAASAAQVWTSSQYIKLVSGTLSNITYIYSQVDGIGGSAGSGPGTPATPSSTLTRLTATYTLGTGATNVRMSMPITVNNASAVDATFRIYQPQLELGSFATSPIPTTSVAVTRSADVGYISGLVVPSAWTAFGDAQIIRAPSSTSFISEGGLSSLSGWTIGTTSSGSNLRLLARQSNPGDTQGGSGAGTTIAIGIARAAVTSLGGFGANGQNPTSGTTPASTTWAEGFGVGMRYNGGSPSGFINNPIRRIVIYPRAMGNAELQAITTAGAY